MIAMRANQQLGDAHGQAPNSGPGNGPSGFVPPPLPPGPPPNSTRVHETAPALPGVGDGDPFAEPPLAGGGLPGMPGA